MKEYKGTTPQAVVSPHLEIIVHEPEPMHVVEPFEIVLFHGSCHTAECWHHFQESFAQAGYRSLAINLRGHGKSQGRESLLRNRLQDYVADVEQVIRERVSGPFVLVGHSVGGYVVQSYLYQPNLPRPAGTVLLASPTIAQVQQVRPDLKTLLPYIGLFVRMAITGNARSLYPTPKETRRWFFTPDTPQETVDDCFRHLQDDSIRASFDSSRLPSPEKQGRPPGETPMLLIGADRDALFPPTAIQASAAAYNAEAMIFLKRGHDQMLDQGWEEVAEYMVQWMKSHLLPDQMKQAANIPMTQHMKQAANATMTQRVMQMSVEPYQDGKFVYRVVEIRGRKSETMHQTPLAVYQHDGVRYLIAPERSRDWVQNLVAAGECLLITKTQQDHCSAILAFDPSALAAVRAYIGQLAWASRQFPFSVKDSDAEIVSKAEQFAIFRLSC